MYIVAGNKVAETDFKADSTIVARILLSEILVDRPANARAIVTFGDSITDGDSSTVDANHRWPDVLARRLVDAGGPPVAILNQGISGARILTDRMGVNALARFDRDVLRHRHADTVILMMGINDIGWPDSILEPDRPGSFGRRRHRRLQATHCPRTSSQDAHHRRDVDALRRDIQRSPLEGYYNADKEKKRQAINKWIRESGAFDGVLDFDAVVRNPSRPSYIQAIYDRGDHLHPNDAGYKAMAESIDLKLLGGSR